MADPRPPFRGEEYLLALLLRMVQEHCSTTTAGELDSFGLEAHTDAMRALAEAGFIEITEQDGQRVWGTALPAADALVARYQADKATAR